MASRTPPTATAAQQRHGLVDGLEPERRHEAGGAEGLAVEEAEERRGETRGDRERPEPLELGEAPADAPGESASAQRGQQEPLPDVAEHHPEHEDERRPPRTASGRRPRSAAPRRCRPAGGTDAPPDGRAGASAARSRRAAAARRGRRRPPRGARSSRSTSACGRPADEGGEAAVADAPVGAALELDLAGEEVAPPEPLELRRVDGRGSDARAGDGRRRPPPARAVAAPRARLPRAPATCRRARRRPRRPRSRARPAGGAPARRWRRGSSAPGRRAQPVASSTSSKSPGPPRAAAASASSHGARRPRGARRRRPRSGALPGDREPCASASRSTRSHQAASARQRSCGSSTPSSAQPHRLGRTAASERTV